MTIEELWAASDGEEIEPRELAAFFASQGKGIRLIDCREEDEYAICKLPGAELMRLSDFATYVAKMEEPDARMVVYCHHGMRSLQAVHFLKRKGFRNALSLHGGIDAWSLLIDPEVRRYG